MMHVMNSSGRPFLDLFYPMLSFTLINNMKSIVTMMLPKRVNMLELFLQHYDVQECLPQR